MDRYVTGAVIKRLREQKTLTQAQLAERMCVSDKTISKWETGRGYPDIAMLEPLAQELGVSVPELLSGNDITNANRASNMLRSQWYVCPVCGNVIHMMGEAAISCCGVALPALSAEPMDLSHEIHLERVEDEYFLTVDHPMTKEHYISFIAYLTSGECQIVKLYPEGNAQTRFKLRGSGKLLVYCNRDGLFEYPINRKSLMTIND